MQRRVWWLVAPSVFAVSVSAAQPVALAQATQRTTATTDPTANVAVVIDFGVHTELSPRVIIKCLKVAAGTTGAEVLASVTRSFHIQAPTYATSGLLCSIAGHPKIGCGTSEHGGYAYWSYWHGGRRWAYASVGPAAWVTSNGGVEGWRYQNPGTASPSDPAPAAPSGFAGACAAAVTNPAPAQQRGSGSGSTTIFAATALLVVALGAGGAIQWRRRARA